MKKARFGVVGAGLWGSFHCRTLAALAGAELVAVCDLDPARVAAMQAEFGAPKTYTDYRALIADPDVDAVTVATPDFAHADIVLAAIEAGKHVMSEKPLATTLAEAEAIAEAAAKRGVTVMVDFHNRVNPAVSALRDAIGAGEIGRPLHASARLSNTLFVPHELLSWAARSSALWFLGSHAVDALRFVMGAEVTRVQAMVRRGHLAAGGVDTADVHLSLLEFDNGAIAQLENSWVMPRDMPLVFDFKLEIVGETGLVAADTAQNGAFRKYAGAGLRTTDLFGVTPAAGGRIGGFVMEAIARFVDAVTIGAPVIADARDGLQVTRVLAAIEEAAATGRTITLASGVA
ncbi:Gfo/Idh/MocA family protein [Prosthecomicrobium pneumaticum]|uniref:Gfo/Idh/MocA family protein n=1 Tax=Prosthecomicrobium pneumaticum TaxID=81895 RepID=UPI0016136AD1|nr:Gfo/Idh/MocA family oxidoreductase [Prosthecomicrobium pneumaticum]